MSLDRLTSEDLYIWRHTIARRDALEIHPQFFSRDEAIEILTDFYSTTGKVFRDYELEEEDFQISPYTGRIIESEA